MKYAAALGRSMFLVAIGFLTGCASFTPQMRTTDRADSCIYGDLINEGTSICTIGMIIRGIGSSEKYTMRFETDKANPIAINVAPGIYKIEEIVGTRLSIIEDAVDLSAPEYHKPFVVEPGTAHYIGSFKGACYLEVWGAYPNSTTMIGDMAVDAADYRFEWCTKRFRMKFPNMSELSAKPLFFTESIPLSPSPEKEKELERNAITPASRDDLNYRFKALESLKEEGLISDDEYRAKRETLLEEL